MIVLAASTSACTATQVPTDLDGGTPDAGTVPSGRPDSGPAPDPCEGAPRDPGRVTLHRLNRAEYNNTVRDLFGTDLRPADDFPYDDHGYGFDNIADVLALSPALLEKYDLAAHALLEESLAVADGRPIHRRFEAELMEPSTGALHGDYGWNLYTNGDLLQSFILTVAGEYLLEVVAFGQQAGPEPVRMELEVDGASLGTFDVTSEEAAPQTISVRIHLSPGTHTAVIRFLNDFYEEPLDRNLVVDHLIVEGPFDAALVPLDPERYARLISCDPAQLGQEPCARQVLGAFARRAFRRPVAAAELDRLVALAQVAFTEGDSFVAGVRTALHAILLSPHFLFRVELDAEPTSLAPHPLTSHELASRLSYFVWSSMPDEALLARADDGSLSSPEVLRAEVSRMLRDERSVALIDNFAGQWLKTRALDDVFPDYAVYPAWSTELREAMRQETRLFFEVFLREPRSALDMFDAEFTFVDPVLARYYGLPVPAGPGFSRVALSGGQRGGLLTQASILTVTSRPKRTSPVKRGKWILEQLLCFTPPPPPPGVEALAESSTVGSVRERTEAHRQNPECIGCHAAMDPLGFALENYDGIGGWRDTDLGAPVDASGELPDGRTFVGAVELGRILKADSSASRCMTERFFTYALGRGVEAHDACALADIEAGFRDGGYTLEALIASLISHPSFTSRRGEATQRDR